MRTIVLACGFALLAGCVSMSAQSESRALELTLNAYANAIRWGDIDGAWSQIDPAWKDAHPLTDIDFSRYKQVQISGYRDQGGTVSPQGEMIRDIEIGVINRNTLAERTVRYRERWRYDEAAKTWWLVTGLPDLWAD